MGVQGPISAILAGLSDLRVLKLHLDLPNAVNSNSLLFHSLFENPSTAINRFHEEVQVLVEAIVRALSSTLEEVWVVQTTRGSPSWRVYDVMRAARGSQGEGQLGNEFVQYDF